MKITISKSNHMKKHTKNGLDEYELIKIPRLKKLTKYIFFFKQKKTLETYYVSLFHGLLKKRGIKQRKKLENTKLQNEV